MKGDYAVLAFKNLKHRGVRSWLTLIGIVIGIMAVVSLISLGTALKTAVTSQFGVSTTEVITIQAGGLNSAGPPGSGAVNKLTLRDAEAIERLSSIELAIPRIISTVKIEFNKIVRFGYSTSAPMGKYRKFAYEALDFEIERGRLLQDGDTNKVVLGNNFYTDDITYGEKIDIGNYILLQDERFEVVGIIKKKGSFILDNIVLMNDDSLRDLLNYGERADLIVAKVTDKSLMDRAANEIENEMRKRRNVRVGEEDFEVSTPEAALATVNSVLGGVQAFIVIIAFISIIVGAIGIVNTMTTSVLERKKEIGIMKAVGARNSQIFLQFLFESGLLGLVGGLVGAILGTLIGIIGTVGINNFLGAEIGINVDLFLISLTLIGSFLVGSISGILPAMQAARQNPVEALRG